MAAIPSDYLHKVYAGVLGKLIGVYLGRPFENWTYQQILDKLGPIDYYVHDKFNLPLVVIDDDVSGTFMFVRALEEHGASPDLTSEQVGKTWLNNIIEKRSVFWWGGNGISTEHTVFLNLKRGIAAPESGSMKTNGRTLAEQIGSQIFIDGWALVAPGNSALAARLAETAARVSHDGEAVYAAKLWAAMEAEAFVSKDVDHLLDTGLSLIPEDSAIAKLITDIRAWTKEDRDWKKTRDRIEDKYGYEKYHGICHVIPNHGIMILSLLYGHDFHQAMHIINTCGWDTDCNSGNVGCLVAIMHGLSGFEGGPDWRGPLADRALISSADNGYSINDAVRISYDIVKIGHQLAGAPPLQVPSKQFNFSLPGSVQGFQASKACCQVATVRQGEVNGAPGLEIDMKGLDAADVLEVTTPTFTPQDVLTVSRHYEMMASPLIYPGQRLTASFVAASQNSAGVRVCLRLKAYDVNDKLVAVDSDPIELQAGQAEELTWIVPRSLENRPIQQLGVVVSSDKKLDGTVWLKSLGWEGMPTMTLKRPENPEELGGTEHVGSGSFWEKSWVSSVDKFHSTMGPSFYIAQDRGEGIISHGTRDWTDYQAVARGFCINLGARSGLAVRVQGLNRYYALVFQRGGRIALVKAADEQRTELAAADFDWGLDEKYELTLAAKGTSIYAKVGNVELRASDSAYGGGAVGLIVMEGSLSADSIEITPS